MKQPRLYDIWIYWVSGHVDFENKVTEKRLQNLQRSKAIEKIEIENKKGA